MTKLIQPKLNKEDFDWGNCHSQSPILCSRVDYDTIFTVIKIKNKFVFIGKTNNSDDMFDTLSSDSSSDITWMRNNIKFIRYYADGDQLIIESGDE